MNNHLEKKDFDKETLQAISAEDQDSKFGNNDYEEIILGPFL
tara:strand:- start:3352 stop:3477 length:126 start_codon:yes stop_codon:yes gene_type:complete